MFFIEHRFLIGRRGNDYHHLIHKYCGLKMKNKTDAAHESGQC